MSVGFLSVYKLINDTEFGRKFCAFHNAKLANWGDAYLADLSNIVNDFAAGGSPVHTATSEEGEARGLDVVFVTDRVKLEMSKSSEAGAMVLSQGGRFDSGSGGDAIYLNPQRDITDAVAARLITIYGF